MSRTSTLLGALEERPATTSELYRRLGYFKLTELGLVAYPAFRSELDKLADAGLVDACSTRNGSTMWRLAAKGPDPETGAHVPHHEAGGHVGDHKLRSE